MSLVLLPQDLVLKSFVRVVRALGCTFSIVCPPPALSVESGLRPFDDSLPTEWNTFFPLGFSRQSFFVQLSWLSWNLFFMPGWPQTQ